MNEKAPRTRGLFGLGSGAAKRPFLDNEFADLLNKGTLNMKEGRPRKSSRGAGGLFEIQGARLWI